MGKCVRYVIPFLILIALPYKSYANEQIVRAIVGEAANQGEIGMHAVACGIRNRGWSLQGVYGAKSKLYDTEPLWVRDQAKRALKKAREPNACDFIHGATLWENTVDFGNPWWYDSVELVYQHKNHKFFVEK